MIYILCFGNPYIESDSLALQVADHFQHHPIKDVEFVKCIAPDEVFNYVDKDFYILDVVQGIKEVTMIDDIDVLANEPKATAHDFDLGFFLRMMKEMGRLKKVRIIGIPMGKKVEGLKEKIVELIS
ncbi:TPA: hypothetical protein HA265_05650 [Candidatus Woesearchaeota archaeon]|nr:hypothetical protein [Candidatus Woesearchaeota archaeon]